MTQKSQVDNHTLAHKVLDTKNLLLFVVSVWLFFFYSCSHIFALTGENWEFKDQFQFALINSFKCRHSF